MNKYSLKDAQRIAAYKNGICISGKWSTKKMEWKCHKGHIWDESFYHINEGNWCPFCSGRRRSANDMYNEIIEVVTKKGGKCLSSEYTNNSSLMLFECADKHQWHARPYNIKSGKWCPYCSKYLNEKKCRYILESLTKCKFPKHRFIYKNIRMEFDGFCEELNLAFEYQGEQHFRMIKGWHKTASGFKLQQYRDKQKIIHCKKTKINIIIIPFQESKNDNNLIEFISRQASKHLQLKLDSPEMSQFYVKCSSLNQLKQIAKCRGGELISDKYYGTHSKMSWKCKNGHSWDATVYSIKSGTWCPECAKYKRWDTRKRTNINDIYNVAIHRGGKCLSKVYTNSTTKLKWECSKGHSWDALWSNVKRGSWCPACANTRKGRRFNSGIQKLAPYAT